jgi:hypothetical protein
MSFPSHALIPKSKLIRSLLHKIPLSNKGRPRFPGGSSTNDLWNKSKFTTGLSRYTATGALMAGQGS